MQTSTIFRPDLRIARIAVGMFHEPNLIRSRVSAVFVQVILSTLLPCKEFGYAPYMSINYIRLLGGGVTSVAQ
jgi:hypothetical protein